MRLDIVTHCVGRDYAGYLAWFLHALVKNPPRRPAVSVQVVATGDEASLSLAKHYRPLLTERCIDFDYLGAVGGTAYNRAIWRNLLAQDTDADWVWFTDVDYFTGHRFLDRVGDQLAALPADAVLACPRRVRVCSPRDGRALARQWPTDLPAERFPATKCPCNDRGTLLSSFFVRGDVARRGYLNDRPDLLKPAEQWQPQALTDFKYLKSLRAKPRWLRVRWLYRMGN